MRDSIKYLMLRSVSGLLSLFLVAILTRFLGAQQYGLYSVVFTTASFLGSLLYHWLREGLLRFIHVRKSGQSNQELLVTIAWTWMVITTCFLCIGGIVTSALTISTEYYFLLGLVPVIGWHGLNLELARSRFKVGLYAVLWIGRALLAVMLPVLIGVFVALNATVILITATLSFLLPSLLTWSWWRPFNHRVVDVRLVSEMFSYGMPFAIGFLLEQAIQVLGRQSIIIWSHSEEVGYFAAAMDTIWLGTAMIALAVNSGYLPRIMFSAENESIERAQQLLGESLVMVLLMLMPIGIVVAALPSTVSVLLTGAGMSGAVAPLLPWIFAAVTLYVVKMTYIDVALKLHMRTREQVPLLVLTLLVFGVAAYFLVSSDGAIGAAKSVVLALIVAVVSTSIVGRKYLPTGLYLRKLALVIIVGLAVTVAMFIMSAIGSDGVFAACIGIGVQTVLMLVLNLGGLRALFARVIFSGRSSGGREKHDV